MNLDHLSYENCSLLILCIFIKSHESDIDISNNYSTKKTKFTQCKQLKYFTNFN